MVLSLSHRPLPLPLPLPLPPPLPPLLPLPLPSNSFFSNCERGTGLSPRVKPQLQPKCSRHCGQSRHCAYAPQEYSALPLFCLDGSTLERVGLAHISSSERAATATAARSDQVLTAYVLLAHHPCHLLAHQICLLRYAYISSMGEKTPPREPVGELPSSTDAGVPSSASTGGSLAT